ncbi:uncharacterized protein [Nicotiana tomentosiformis]|uniref:uncharacterized protein n=1 Tax=Nicotiana tomentosiformis TaxID=4098 RepID=UPI00388C3D8E
MAEELKKLTGRVHSAEDGKGIEGLNYEDLCIQLDVELPEAYKPPKFEMFDITGDPKVHLITYCDKLVGVGKDARIPMKLFMRSLNGDDLSWYISQNPKKWVNWVSMASDFMDQFRFNTENAPNIFYIQNLKNKPTETFCEYATRWRSEAAKVDGIENHKFFDIIKLGGRIEEGIKRGMVTNFEALQATNKALQSGGISKKKEVGAVMWINSNKTCAYHSGMKGHIIKECLTLKDKIHTLIDTKVIQANKTTPNVRNNPLPDHRGDGVNMIETDEEWDPE